MALHQKISSLESHFGLIMFKKATNIQKYNITKPSPNVEKVLLKTVQWTPKWSKHNNQEYRPQLTAKQYLLSPEWSPRSNRNHGNPFVSCIWRRPVKPKKYQKKGLLSQTTSFRNIKWCFAVRSRRNYVYYTKMAPRKAPGNDRITGAMFKPIARPLSFY